MQQIPTWVIVSAVALVIFGFLVFAVIPAIQKENRKRKEEQEKETEKNKDDEDPLF